MTTVLEIVRAAIPGADESDAEHILWGRTPFPMTRVPAREIYKAASGARRAYQNGLILCDHCERVANFDRYLCASCADGLGRVMA